MSDLQGMAPAPEQHSGQRLEGRAATGNRRSSARTVRRLRPARSRAGEERQRQPGGQRQVELGDEVPDAEAGPGLPLTLAEVGGDGGGQGQVGTERQAGSDADGGKRPQVAGCRAGWRRRRRAIDRPWPEPGMNPSAARRKLAPRAAARRRRQRSTVPAGAARRSSCSTSATKKRNSVAGTAAAMPLAMKDAEQAAKGAVIEDPAQAGQQRLPRRVHRLAGADPAEGGDSGDQQQRRQHPERRLMPSPSLLASNAGRAAARTTPSQPEAFAGRGQPRALGGSGADVGAPGLIGDRCGREAEVGQRQRAGQPRRREIDRRVEQGDETERRRAQGQRHHGRARHAIGQPAQPRVDAGIEQAGAEQDGAEQREFQPAPRHRSAAHGRRSAAPRRPAADRARRRRGRGRRSSAQTPGA
jgi:hypothetical protein